MLSFMPKIAYMNRSNTANDEKLFYDIFMN